MKQTLKEILVNALVLEVDPADIQDEAPLADYGVDSFKLLEYLSALEENLDVHFPQSELTAENLCCITSIERLVNRLADTQPGK